MDKRINNIMQVASLRRYVMTDGKEKGLEVIDIDNGVLRILLNVSKALDVMQVYHRGENVSFISKNGFTAREVPFIKRFEGGMLYTVGLDSAGGREGFDLHGTFHNIPSKVIKAEIDGENIEVVAEVYDTELFGKNLTLKRIFKTVIGSDSFTIDDELINGSYRDEEYCLLYHINVGYPMLTDGGTLTYDAKNIVARTKASLDKIDRAKLIEEPVDNQEENCYFIDMKVPKAEYFNPVSNKKFVLEYSGDTLTEFIEWKSMVSGDYALGLEPSTTKLDNGFKFNTVKKQSSVKFNIKISIKD